MTTKIGRNEPCPCGSGKKCKKCCGREKPAPVFSIPESERTGTPMDEVFALLPFLRLQGQKIIRFEKDGPELKKAIHRYEKPPASTSTGCGRCSAFRPGRAETANLGASEASVL